MTTIVSTMPDAGTDVEAISLQELQAELQCYKPGTSSELVSTNAWLVGRMQLWRRLDELNGVRRPAIARPAVVAS